MSAALEARVAKLEAAEAIRNLRASYANTCDAGFDPKAMAAHYTEDGVLDNGEVGVLHGRAEIETYFAGVPALLSWCAHYMATSAIEVADDAQTATGRWSYLEPATLAGDAYWVMGVYHDTYRLTADGWKLETVRNEAIGLTPYAAGWAKELFPATPLSWGGEDA
jgi:ketosteroid isomerase-like protein